MLHCPEGFHVFFVQPDSLYLTMGATPAVFVVTDPVIDLCESHDIAFSVFGNKLAFVKVLLESLYCYKALSNYANLMLAEDQLVLLKGLYFHFWYKFFDDFSIKATKETLFLQYFNNTIM